MRKLAARIRAQQSYLLYAMAAVILIICLAAMVIHKFTKHSENILAAGAHNQLVVFDLSTGKQVDPLIITGKATAKAAQNTTAKSEVTPPIKQADVMFIIDNLGINKSETDRAIDLPKQFILAFSPYTDLSLEMSKSAYEQGHVVLADLPTQSKDGSAPGNLTLKIENNDFRNSRNLDAILSKIYEASGVLTQPEDIFTRSNNFSPILHEIARRKLFLAYGGDGEDIDTKAHDNDVDLLKIDIVLNEEEDLSTQLANVEKLVAKNGFVVVMIKSPATDSLDVIGKWSRGLKVKNIRLISSQK